MSLAGGKALPRLGYSPWGVNIPPAIAIAWQDDPGLKLVALEQGADDVVAIPFAPKEFLARALVIVRHTYREAASLTPILRLGDIEIDTFHRRVRVNGVELRLTALEQRLLYLLASHVDRVLTRDEILDSIWGIDYIAESNVVDRHIHNLRTKLEAGRCCSHYIATVHGQGYCLTSTAARETRSSAPRTAPLAQRRRILLREPGLAIQESRWHVAPPRSLQRSTLAVPEHLRGRRSVLPRRPLSGSSPSSVRAADGYAMTKCHEDPS